MGTEQKNSKKPLFIAMAILVVLIPSVWIWMNRTAVESVISSKTIQIDNSYKIVKLSERTNQMRHRRTDDYLEETKVYGYVLELIDSISGSSLQKLEFKPSSLSIDKDPVLLVQEDGDVWIIGTTNSRDNNNKGFVLKYKINNNALTETNFKMDENYWISNIKDSWILLGDGTASSGAYNPAFGGIYFDINSEKVVDDRKKFD